MSDNLQQRRQGSSSSTFRRRPADPRQAFSCSECRRRKQKCSQGQPCTNCARRFPQPICEYEVRGKVRNTGPRATRPNDTQVPWKPYAHLKLEGMQEAIILVEELHGAKIHPKQSEDESFSLIPYSTHPGDPTQPLTASPVPSTEFIGHYRNWLPFRLIVQDRGDQPEHVLIRDAVKAVNGSGNENSRVSAEDDCLADAIKLVETAQGANEPAPYLPPEESEFNRLPMASTKLNKELVRTFLRLLCRFKGSVSGTLDDNPLRNRWTNAMIQEPLLMKITLFTSACFLNEMSFIPKSVVIALRGIIYMALNEQLASKKNQVNDVTVLGVCEMVMDEWCWGTTHQLHAHMNGLKVMIKMRGGLRNLGMHGYLSKMILVHDYSIAVSHEAEPDIYGRPGYEFEDPVMVPFETSLNCPFMFNGPSFANSAASLHLHPCTAVILDDVRAMMQAITTLPPDADEASTAEAVEVAHLVYRRICELPENVSFNQVYNLNNYTSFVPLGSYKRSSESPSDTTGSPESSGGAKGGQSLTQTSNSPGAEAVEKEKLALTNPDQMYSLVRLTALLYCRAIINRTPTSKVCTDEEFTKLWQLIWRIPVAARRSIVGIFLWAVIAIIPSSHEKPQARFLKTLISNSYLTIAVENWHLGIEAADTALRLQRWLRGTSGSQGMVIGGESIIEKYGWAQKEVLKNIATIHKPTGSRVEEDDDDGEEQGVDDTVMQN